MKYKKIGADIAIPSHIIPEKRIPVKSLNRRYLATSKQDIVPSRRTLSFFSSLSGFFLIHCVYLFQILAQLSGSHHFSHLHCTFRIFQRGPPRFQIKSRNFRRKRRQSIGNADFCLSPPSHTICQSHVGTWTEDRGRFRNFLLLVCDFSSIEV